MLQHKGGQYFSMQVNVFQSECYHFKVQLGPRVRLTIDQNLVQDMPWHRSGEKTLY